MTKRKSYPIPFNEKEQYLLEWAKSRDKPFATYIKDLIREDMKICTAYDKNELKTIVKELMKELNIEVKPPEVKKSGLSNKSKSAYKNLLKKG